MFSLRFWLHFFVTSFFIPMQVSSLNVTINSRCAPFVQVRETQFASHDSFVSNVECLKSSSFDGIVRCYAKWPPWWHNGPRWVNELSKTKVDHYHHYLALLIQSCWHIARPCESDFGLWMIRQGWTNEHLSALLHPSTERGREGEREREYTGAKSRKCSCMPWLVGNRVTCHRSRRINKLARSDEFGSIIETLDTSWKKWFARITRIVFFSRSRNFDLSFNVFWSENVKVQLESFPNCFDQCMIYNSFSK